MAKKISQREAQRLQKQVFELSEKVRKIQCTWRREYPAGAHIGSRVYDANDKILEAIRVSHLLGHAIVATRHAANEIAYYAVPVK